MFPKRFYGLVFSFVMSILMSALMSLVITLLHVAWGLSWVIAWPTIVIVSPLVNRIVGFLVVASKEEEV